MDVTPTLLSYFVLCQRKAWLFANGLEMEQTSDLVAEGKLIGESSYKRRSGRYKELNLGNAKIDFYDPVNKVVHEVKKSNKLEVMHLWQVKYYLYILESAGIEGARGVLEYPQLRETKEVFLTKADRQSLSDMIADIQVLIVQDGCPPGLDRKTICKSCSFFDFCWSGEQATD